MTEDKITSLDRHIDLGLLWNIVGPYRGRLIVVLCLVLVNTAIASLGIGMILPVFQALLDPAHNSKILSRLMPQLEVLSPNMRIIALAGGTVMLFAVKEVISLVARYFTQDLLQSLRIYWVTRIGERYLLGRYLWLAGQKQGKLLNDWFNETVAATRFFQSYVAYLSATALAFALMVLGFLVHWQLMLALLAGGCLIGLLVSRLLYGKSGNLSRQRLVFNQAVTNAMSENLANARELKLLVAERVRLDHLARFYIQVKRINVISAVITEFPGVIGEFLAVFVLMTLLAGGLVGLGLTPQDMLPFLIFFFVSFYRLVTSASQAMSARVRALTDVHSVRLIGQLVGGDAVTEDHTSGMPIRELQTDIRMHELHFRFDNGKEALTGISAVIPKGKVTLLIGPSGAGKSTLLDLLLRLEVPSQGSILANDHHAAAFNLPQWRRRFGYVSQDAVLFNGSIRMNLQLAKPDASEAELLRACQLARAIEFIRVLPGGLDAVIGDRGYSLSGGQRKRIAIARALVSSPDVLILDEATTSFEHSLEQEILKDVKHALPDLTVIQVTHRLYSGTIADWVIGLNEGKVAFSGPCTDSAPYIEASFGPLAINERP